MPDHHQPPEDPSPIEANSGKPLLSRRRVLQLASAAFVATTLDGIYTSEDIKFEHHRLTLPRWDANGFKVAQVSDVHLNNTMLRDRANAAFALAMSAKPDLLVFTGDFLNEAHEETLGYVVQVFERLADAGCPCLAVPGNHDWTCKATLRLFQTVEALPIQLLRNNIVDVAGVSVVGLDDPLFGRANMHLTASPDLSRSTLVLMHEPDYVGDIQGKPSLVLSGHSHGGEICLPGGIPIHTPTAAQVYKSGYYPDAPTPLYVSRGVGTLGPFRCFCPPEVTVFTLYGENA